ncbi:unnamed protein product [Paramecium primaurelia]|uniref:Uncharacterized protein n=1 Tax=Paramecium primaurelia TaxID=5886 RepID=A0A8S1NLB2_PARPR|nr:unnamed protein product [Paramecium primaurelia]
MITSRSQNKLLNYSPLPIKKSENLLKNISRLDQQIYFLNSYIEKYKAEKKKRRIPFECCTPLRVQALKLNLSFNKTTTSNKTLRSKKIIANEQNYIMTPRKTKQNDEQQLLNRTKNSVSRWEEQIDQNESFLLYHF